jgi:hypothetical protein
VGWADWAVISEVADDVLIAVGIGFLVVRQFVWRSAQLSRMLRMPVAIIAIAIGYLVVEFSGGLDWVPADWIIVAELLLVACTGTAMGHVTRFRTAGGRLQYKLTGAGIWLWLVFLCIRAGSFAIASVLGANLGEATGIVLLSFGINRLAAVLVVRRRIEISQMHALDPLATAER